MSIVLLFKNSPTSMQFLLRFHRFRRLLNSATAALLSRIDAHTLAGLQHVFAFPQDVVSQASKASPRCQTTGRLMQTYKHPWISSSWHLAFAAASRLRGHAGPLCRVWPFAQKRDAQSPAGCVTACAKIQKVISSFEFENSISSTRICNEFRFFDPRLTSLIIACPVVPK